MMNYDNIGYHSNKLLKMKQLYILDPSSKKFICPRCEKKTFVRFIHAETKEYLPMKYGRCDREIKCRYFVHPYEKKEEESFSVMLSDQMKPTLKDYDKNTFILALAERYDIEAINTVIEKFKIGTGSGKYAGWPIFWQVDHFGNIRTGHMIKYNGLKRTKYQNWTHSLLYENYRLKQCLYGLHQLKGLPTGKQINIVEAEKTAIIGSIYFPGETWMATCGKNNLKRDSLVWLHPHPIHLYPDTDSIEYWRKIASGYNNVTLYDWRRDIFTDEIAGLAYGSDYADFLLNHTPEELKPYALN